MITVSKYHHIGNEKLVETLADTPDAEAEAQLAERGVQSELVAELVQEHRDRAARLRDARLG